MAESTMDTLSTQLQTLSESLSLHNVGPTIPTCNGEKGVGQWLAALDKHIILERLSPEKQRLLAYRTSSGYLSDFIHRYLVENEQGTYAELRSELAARFSDIKDKRQALDLLKKVRQQPQESIQIFAERLVSLIKNCYDQTELENAANELVFIDYLIDGLRDNNLKIKLIRDNPKSFKHAVDTCIAETNMRSRIDMRVYPERMRSGEVAMEIGAHRRMMRPQPRVQFDNHRPPPSRHPMTSRPHPQQNRHAVNEIHQAGPPVCQICFKPGHSAIYCFQRYIRKPNSSNSSKPLN